MNDDFGNISCDDLIRYVMLIRGWRQHTRHIEDKKHNEVLVK